MEEQAVLPPCTHHPRISPRQPIAALGGQETHAPALVYAEAHAHELTSDKEELLG